MWRVGVITVSDKGSNGEREDQSGELLRRMVKKIQGEVVCYVVIPDDLETIRETLVRFCDGEKLDLIFTTGGTGLSPRDVTPEATQSVIQREVPGIAEAMRQKTSAQTKYALLSRQVTGVRGSTLIINLPGSPKAVQECYEVIEPILPHGLEIMTGKGIDHDKK